MIWVTRAEPGASRTAERLRALGHTPLVAPLIALQPLDVPAAALSLEGVGALAFTSAAGVEAFARLSPARDRPVYAVGDATAAAAASAGFPQVRSAGADGEALAALIAGDPDRPPGAILAPGARARAFDLEAALARRGVAARSPPLYEAVPLREAPPPLMLAVEKEDLEGVLLHSPAAARALQGPVARGLARALDRLPVYALSPAVAAALPRRLRGSRHVAAAPREAELLALLPPPA